MNSDPATSDTYPPPAPLWRRLMAMLYDSLLCIALIFVVTALYTGLHKLLISIGLFSDRYATMTEPGGSVGYDPVMTLVLVASLWLFFGFFWRRAGQTLGMQTWRIRIENTDGSVVSWTQALLRIIAGALSWATFGLGWLWQWLDPQHRSWTDRLSGSRTVQLAKRKKKQ
ncbi:MAG: RDD family protein [Halospina sp.]